MPNNQISSSQQVQNVGNGRNVRSHNSYFGTAGVKAVGETARYVTGIKNDSNKLSISKASFDSYGNGNV